MVDLLAVGEANLWHVGWCPAYKIMELRPTYRTGRILTSPIRSIMA
jgi:hypothetical protein